MSRKANTNKPVDTEPRNVNITIRFSRKEADEIERIAKEMDIHKTRLIRNLTLSSLDDAKILSNLGVIKGTKKFIEFKEAFLNLGTKRAVN